MSIRSTAGQGTTAIWPLAISPPETDAALRAIEQHAAPGHRDRITLAVTETNAIDWSQACGNNNGLGHALVLFDMLGQ